MSNVLAQRVKFSSGKGFTLIELMIVVAIIGILAAIAMPKFASLISKSKEGHTKGSLGIMRTALSVYYSDNNGIYPTDDLSILINSAKYLSEIPKAQLPNTPHEDSSAIAVADNETGLLTDNGGWAYNNGKSDPYWGHIIVNCQHTDSGSIIWSSF